MRIKSQKVFSEKRINYNGMVLLSAVLLFSCSVPEITEPKNGEVVDGPVFTLSWEGRGEQFEVIASADQNFESLQFQQIVEGNSLELGDNGTNSLSAGPWYFRVRQLRDREAEGEDWSEPVLVHFTGAEEPLVNLHLSVPELDDSAGYAAEASWSINREVDGEVHLQVSANEDFSDLIMEEICPEDGSVQISDLDPGQYYLRFRFQHRDSGFGYFSETDDLKVISPLYGRLYKRDTYIIAKVNPEDGDVLSVHNYSLMISGINDYAVLENGGLAVLSQTPVGSNSTSQFAIRLFDLYGEELRFISLENTTGSTGYFWKYIRQIDGELYVLGRFSAESPMGNLRTPAVSRVSPSSGRLRNLEISGLNFSETEGIFAEIEKYGEQYCLVTGSLSGQDSGNRILVLDSDFEVLRNILLTRGDSITRIFRILSFDGDRLVYWGAAGDAPAINVVNLQTGEVSKSSLIPPEGAFPEACYINGDTLYAGCGDSLAIWRLDGDNKFRFASMQPVVSLPPGKIANISGIQNMGENDFFIHGYILEENEPKEYFFARVEMRDSSYQNVWTSFYSR